MRINVANKLRINLARWSSFSFRITTEANLGQDITELLDINLKHRYKTLYEKYTRSGITHSMLLRFARRERQPELFAIRLVYETQESKGIVPRLIIAPTTLKPSEGFLHICKLESPLLFRCDCSFTYTQAAEKVPFYLPIQMEDEFFNEIRGVKLVKLEHGKILWENYLDLIESDKMTHRIKFARYVNCTSDLPQKLLRQAKEISLKT